MEREGEGRSTADTARERRQHEERAAGPAAQFTHHETASTQGGHTTPAAPHHAGGEDIHHHLPQLIPAAPGKWPKPRAHHTTHTEQANPHPSMTRHKNFLPSRPQWDTEPNSAQSHAVHHTHRKIDSGCALPLSLLLMATEEDNSRHTQLPACTTKGAFKPTAMCILCVWLCVPAATQSKEIEKREQSMWRDAQNAQRRRITETTRRPLKLMTALQPKQWQFTQDLLKTKKRPPSSYINPITQNNYK
ncbi:hypothetical protein ECC02_012124 [Trypanosoma cruzi]|uniref:Uncharacterized protein n=1 Tax=Trypanosoma cruzi TaxID=5693 RepID=A0A7J6XMV6_TRYCR|nr:hypothetical protein ECC02_012124 [Trypanosoma cruzi]